MICEPGERKYRPTNVVEAQFSLPFGVAVALLRRRAGLDEFSEGMLQDAEILRLMSKVDYERDTELEKNYPKEWPAWARITLNNGREVSAAVRFPKGDPENPLSWDELTMKYADLVTAVWADGHAVDVCEAVRKIENETDLQNFTQAL